MPLDVSSSFAESLKSRSVNLQRQLLIGTSDYSDYVLRWPRIRTKWDEPRSHRLNIELSNADGAMNPFLANPLLMRNTVQIKLTEVGCTAHTTTLLQGKMSHVKVRDAKATLHVGDKLRDLMDRSLGSRETSIDFANTLISDVAYTIVTCYGGFDGTSSTANTDIDWEAFSSWHADATDNTVTVDAHFDGQKISEALEIISHMYDTAIFLRDDKLVFERFGFGDSDTTNPVTANTAKITAEVDDEHMINRVKVLAKKTVGTGSFTVEVTEANTASVNSYGPREDQYDNETIWYVDSAQASNQAQRAVSVFGLPSVRFRAEGPLVHASPSVGHTVIVSDTNTGISGNYRVMSKDLDIENGRVILDLESTRLFSDFILDISILDGDDLLG